MSVAVDPENLQRLLRAHSIARSSRQARVMFGYINVPFPNHKVATNMSGSLL